MQPANRFFASSKRRLEDVAFALCLSVVALAPVALAVRSGLTPVDDAVAATMMAAASGPTRPTGTFTGEYVNGAPVYRMPAIQVFASREEELARIRLEDERAQAAATAMEKSGQPPVPTAAAGRGPRGG